MFVKILWNSFHLISTKNATLIYSNFTRENFGVFLISLHLSSHQLLISPVFLISFFFQFLQKRFQRSSHLRHCTYRFSMGNSAVMDIPHRFCFLFQDLLYHRNIKTRGITTTETSIIKLEKLL